MYHVCRALLKAAVIVVPILGCTWVFGLLAINENTVAFAWIFTIFNSLQVSCLSIMFSCFSEYLSGCVHHVFLCTEGWQGINIC